MANGGRKPERNNATLVWARSGAIVALVLSAASMLLPAPWGGFGLWSDPHLAVHNVAAILTRIVVFTLVGGLIGSVWARRRRKRA